MQYIYKDSMNALKYFIDLCNEPGKQCCFIQEYGDMYSRVKRARNKKTVGHECNNSISNTGKI